MVFNFLIITLLFASSALCESNLPQKIECLNCHANHFPPKSECISCHRGNQKSFRKEIAHSKIIPGRFLKHPSEKSSLRRAENIINIAGCRRCHITGGKGNKLSVNLDSSFTEKDIKALEMAIIKPAEAMPKFNFNRNDLEVIVSTLLNSSQKEGKPLDNIKKVNLTSKKGIDIFNQRCGGCHKALTSKLGAIGRGESGPNLSGILSRFYPSEKSWNRENLKKWLDNPRSMKKIGDMPPQKLTSKEFEELLLIFDND